MKKRIASIALGAALVATPAVLLAGSPAEAGGSKIPPPPDCGSHVACKGDPKPSPSSIKAHNCVLGVSCDDTQGDDGDMPTPDDGCPIGRPCNFDAPGYEKPDVPPPSDKPGQKVEVKSLDPKPKSESDDSVDEAPAARAVTAQPHTVG